MLILPVQKKHKVVYSSHFWLWQSYFNFTESTLMEKKLEVLVQILDEFVCVSLVFNTFVKTMTVSLLPR